MPHLYILRCADNSLYIGSTSNLEQRIKKHFLEWGSQYTRIHKPIELVYTEEYTTNPEAFQRERQLKGWSRAKKEALIAGNFDLLKELSKSKQ